MFIERVLNHFVDCLICVSESDKKQVENFRLIQGEKIQVIPNGIDISRVPVQTNEKRLEIRSSIGMHPKNVVLVTACRLKEPKNVSIIVRALKLLENEHPSLVLLVIGDGPKRIDLEREVDALGLHNHVLFLGQTSSVLDFVLAADIAILSSRWEGLPLFLLEASVCQKPLLGSHVDGIVDVIVDGKTGFLFEENNEENLARQLRIFINDPLKRQSFGVAAYQRVCERFDLKNTVDAYEQLYRGLIMMK